MGGKHAACSFSHLLETVREGDRTRDKEEGMMERWKYRFGENDKNMLQRERERERERQRKGKRERGAKRSNRRPSPAAPPVHTLWLRLRPCSSTRAPPGAPPSLRLLPPPPAPAPGRPHVVVITERATIRRLFSQRRGAFREIGDNHLVKELGKAVLALVEAPLPRPDHFQRLLHLRKHPVSRNGAHLPNHDGTFGSAGQQDD
jgi:hypothetical protein